ncbi:FecR family protein [Bosea lathyri]|uniref:FecR family protein n=1 Tax=Bosea lathyri TaxID=1036778 RepID=A0A1H6D219_9HYPH|nr:FecR family protein [Bosea lathyri]SEG79114.1 FecR family protein [Bosea lathyri]
MTGKSPTNVDGHVLEEAAGWVARLQSRDATDSDRHDFQNWLARDPAHRTAYDELRQLWGELREVPLGSERFKAKTRRVALGNLLTLIVVFGLSFALYRLGLIDRFRADHYTVVGEVRSVALDDGTRVDLNTDSAIAVFYSAGERRIELLRGEAFFDVAKNPARPFIVAEGSWRATALGTRYGVRAAGPSEGDVRVEEGRVEVSNGGDRVVLGAGEAVSLSGAKRLSVTQTDVANETAWRSGKLVFSGRPLREVLTALERYRLGRIVVLDEGAANQTVSGIFDLRDTDQALDVLESSLPLSVHRLSSMIVVVRSR